MTLDSNLAQAMADCREDEVKALVQQKLAAGVPANDVLAECNRGMIELGNRFNREECFLPDLMFGGMIMKGVMAQLSPKLERGAAAQTVGTAVIGTVQYDVHDIGKDILVMMLRGSGFEVVDLGVDVPADKFVEAAKEKGGTIVALSALLTTTMTQMKQVIQALGAAGVRGKTKVMIGGAPITQQYADEIGADGYSDNASSAVSLARKLVA